MKISRQEVEALARLKRAQEEEKVSQYNKSLRNDKGILAEAEKWHKYISKVPAAIWDGVRYSRKKEDIIYTLVKKKAKSCNLRNADVESEVVAIAMTCDTPQQLKKKLGLTI